ncbi:MAG: alpha amylase catalytic region, partial [Acidobacteria bacterium]|nr:alpha amylase catalytic region [Acidobacteriota bacterium]
MPTNAAGRAGRPGTGLAPDERLMALDGRRRVIIESPAPQVDDGRFPAKRVVGDVVLVEADIFADGHDVISAVLLHRDASQSSLTAVRMRPLENDRWQAAMTVQKLGFYYFTFEAWIDHFLTWHRDLKKRVDAQASDLDVQLEIGLAMIRAAAARAKGRDRARLEAFAEMLGSDAPVDERIEEVWSADLLALMWRNAERKYV